MPDKSEIVKRFPTEEVAATFVSTYRAMLDRWPLGVASVDVGGEYGTTHVQVCGPPDGAPLVLLHGGGCTSTVWFANVGDLGRTHRVYALDQIGDAGRSVASGQPIRTVRDLMAWLDGLLDELGLEAAALCGHSYGAWLALNYALHNPSRVARLALLDPMSCFGGLSRVYRLRAVPLFVRPSAPRMRTFLEWETDRVSIDPLSLTLNSLGGAYRGSKLVMPRRPKVERLRASRVSTLLVLAEESRAHNVRRIGENAQRLLLDVTIAVLPGASHHSIPTTNPDRLNQELVDFLARSTGTSRSVTWR